MLYMLVIYVFIFGSIYGFFDVLYGKLYKLKFVLEDIDRA